MGLQNARIAISGKKKKESPKGEISYPERPYKLFMTEMVASIAKSDF
jgi:hypothetical protein